MKEYKARIADKILAEKLDAMGAVLIEGPKYCGKTTLASQQAALQQAIEYFRGSNQIRCIPCRWSQS